MSHQKFLDHPQEQRTQILSAAIRLFSEQPYKTVSISAIMQVAGVTRSTFYNFFPDKKDLYLHILEIGMARKLDLVKALNDSPANLKTFEYLKLIMQASIQFEVQNPDLARIAYRALVEEVPFPGEVDSLANQGGLAWVNDFLAQGILHDDVAPWVDTHMASYLLQTVYHTFGHYMLNRIRTAHPQDPTQNLDVFADQETLDLVSNLMDLLEAGMGRDPEVRKTYYNK